MELFKHNAKAGSLTIRHKSQPGLKIMAVINVSHRMD